MVFAVNLLVKEGPRRVVARAGNTSVRRKMGYAVMPPPPSSVRLRPVRGLESFALQGCAMVRASAAKAKNQRATGDLCAKKGRASTLAAPLPNASMDIDAMKPTLASRWRPMATLARAKPNARVDFAFRGCVAMNRVTMAPVKQERVSHPTGTGEQAVAEARAVAGVPNLLQPPRTMTMVVDAERWGTINAQQRRWLGCSWLCRGHGEGETADGERSHKRATSADP
jgi:hypothetical protein